MMTAIINDMSKASFNILYDGPALTNNQMDVRELAPALLALGDVLEEANAVMNDGKTKISLRVQASFKTGCFGVELDVLQSLLQQAQSLFANEHIATAKQILEWLGLVGISIPVAGKGLFAFIKWLRGRSIQKVVLLEDGRCRVILDDEQIEVEKQIIDLFRREKLRKALQAVLKPLESEGIEHFAITDLSQKEKFFTIDKTDLGFFSAPPPERETLMEEEVIMNLQLVNVAFRDDNKWRFSDGASTFYATIVDESFLNQIQASDASFSKGDILKARMHKKQYLVGEDMRVDYELRELIEHRKSSVQLHIPFERNNSKK